MCSGNLARITSSVKTLLPKSWRIGSVDLGARRPWLGHEVTASMAASLARAYVKIMTPMFSAGENADAGILVQKTGRSSSGLEVPFSKLQTVTLPIFGRQSPARSAFSTDLGVVQGWPTGQSHRQRRPIDSVLDRRERPRRLSPRGRERTSELEISLGSLISYQAWRSRPLGPPSHHPRSLRSKGKRFVPPRRS